MPRARIAAVVAAALLALPASAQAKDLYVSGAGTSAEDCLTLAGACSLDKAVGLATNGDTVFVDGSKGDVTTAPVTIAASIGLRSLDPAVSPKPVISGTLVPTVPVIHVTAAAVGANLSGLDLRSRSGPAVRLDAPGAVLQDSILTSRDTALDVRGAATVRRIVARGDGTSGASFDTPVDAPATIANSLVLSTADTGVGLALRAGRVSAVNLTVIATGGNSSGAWTSGPFVPTDDAPAIVLRNSIVRSGPAGTDLAATRDAGCALGSDTCPAGTITVDHSAYVSTVGPGVVPGAGNTTADPLFVDAAAGDYRLQAASPLRDIGVEDPLSSPLDAPVDLVGSPRKDGPGVDLGAYEYLIPLPPKNPLPPATLSGPPADTTAPTLGVVRLSNARFRVGAQPTALSAATRKRKPRRVPIGTTITVGVTERSTLNYEIDRIVTGRRTKLGCEKATARQLKRTTKKQRCKLALPIQPGFDRAALKPGAVVLRLSGRMGTAALKPGPYRLEVIATDPSGNRSKPRRASFTIVAR